MGVVCEGKLAGDHLETVARATDGVSLEHANVAGVATVKLSEGWIDSRSWFDEVDPGRPWLHLRGEAVHIAGDLPCGVKALTFEEHHGIPVEVAYDFSDEQLAELVRRGLYRTGFAPEETLVAELVQFPVFVEVSSVAPTAQNDVPVLFVDIEDRCALVATQDDCDTDFVAAFPDFSTVEQVAQDEDSDIDDLFDGVTFDEDDDLFAEPVAEDAAALPAAETEAEAGEETTIQTETPVDEHEQSLLERYKAIRSRVDAQMSTDAPETVSEPSDEVSEQSATAPAAPSASTQADDIFTDDDTAPDTSGSSGYDPA